MFSFLQSYPMTSIPFIEQGEIIYQATSGMLQKESDNYDYPKLLVAALKHKNKK